MKTVTAHLSEFAATLRYEDLSAEAKREAVRFLLDTLGCAIAGSTKEDYRLASNVLLPMAGAGKAAVVLAASRKNPLTATLLNSLAVRVMDFNDIYWKQDPSHPSDLIPGVLACCEESGRSGRDLVAGIVLAYEMEQRLCEAAFPGIRERGWHHATLTAFAAPIGAGFALGLDAKQIQHAVGISGSCHATLGAVTAGKLTMMKNTVDPMAVERGVLAALLAREGYTGPEHVMDGKEGLAQCLGPSWKLEVLTEGLGDGWRITRCGMKAFPTEALTHAPIACTLDLVKDHDLTPGDVTKIRIRSLARAADILADPSKYDPRSKETADHSLPYVISAALARRKVTASEFSQESIDSEEIRTHLDKVEVSADEEIEKLFPELQRVVVSIETKGGRVFERTIDYPPGDYRNPISDQALMEKYQSLAGPVLGERAAELAEAVVRIEQTDNLSSFTALLEAAG